MRFEPERSWDDNTNLDKALKLLQPIKDKYGVKLSWSDLIILAGNTAIKEMGGPILGFCGGRIDDNNGKASVLLGPTTEQENLMPCEKDTLCKSPLGASVVGLIYVNAVGPRGEPNPKESAKDIRNVFARMNMNDYETIALIGGGHEFGKAHGACPAGAGDPPKMNPIAPWVGNCGKGKMRGKGINTVTSGLDLVWTTNPLKWEHEYFYHLEKFNDSWVKEIGPGGSGKWQWKIKNETSSPKAINVDGTGYRSIGMLTTDIALLRDTKYQKIVVNFTSCKECFDDAFMHAWYKLTTRDMGPRSRCINKDAPPSQPWQFPLPDPKPDNLKYIEDVKEMLKGLIKSDQKVVALFTRLAWQCSASFRSTDYLGGCNGARIRFPPQIDWAANLGIEDALKRLSEVKAEFEETISWADLIILAGNVAIEQQIDSEIRFCPGRTDAEDENGWPEYIEPKIGDLYMTPSIDEFLEAISVTGLNEREFTALYGAGYIIGSDENCNGLYCQRKSFITDKENLSNARTLFIPDKLSNKFFQILFSEIWIPMNISSVYKKKGIPLNKAEEKEEYMLHQDLLFKDDSTLSAIAKEFAANNQMFLDEFGKAWTKLSNIDRFDGPVNNICEKKT